MNIQKLIIFLTAVFSVATASAQSVLYMGRTVNLVVPTGHCLLGSTPLEAQIKANAAKAMEGYNEVLGAYAECREVEQIRKGQPTAFSSFGQILAQTPKGQPTTAKGMSRGSYIATIVGNPARMEESVRKMKTLMRSRSAEVASAQSLGILKTDDAAAYLAILQDLPRGDGTTTPGTGITAMTVVRDLPVSINFYRRGRGEQVVQQMLETQSTTLKKFVAANQ